MNKSTCLSCNSDQITNIYDFGKIPAVNSFYSKNELDLEESYPLNLNVCNKCFLIQIEEVPEPQILYSEYHHRSAASVGNLNHLVEFKNFIRQKFSLKTKILEIGSNDSTLLNLLNNEGFQCFGVDPAKNLNDSHQNVVSDFFSSKIVKNIKKKYGKFDLIFGLNVFAHNSTFIDMFNAVTELLEKDGVFILEVAYADKTILKGNFDTIYHEHVCSFTLTSLTKALNFANLTVVDVELLNTQGGSLRLICQKLNDNNIQGNKVNEMLSEEIKFGYQDINFYKEISKLIALKIDIINEFFNEQFINNKKILFIGAPARGVVVLNLVKNLDSNTSLVIDDTFEKQNKYFPGKYIQIKSWDKIDYRYFDVAVILSWNYCDYLYDKLREFGFTNDVYVLFPNLKKII